MRARSIIVVTAVAVLGCGGGGGSSGADGGSINFRVLWEGRAGALRADAFASTIPKAVNTVRITLTPSGAPASAGCCVAVRRGTQAFIDRLLLLDGIAEGDYVVTLGGYATDFAPADGAGRRCATSPSSAGSACDSSRQAAPSFGSDGVSVTVEAGERSDAGDIIVYSLPFPVSLAPGEDELVTGPDVAFSGVIADAVNNVDPTSVGIRTGSAGTTLAPVNLDPLIACDDLGGVGVPDCSAAGALEARGYIVTGTSSPLADGDATLNILATNDAAQARQLDFFYDYRVGSPSSTTTSTSTTTTVPAGSTTTTTLASTTSTTVSSTTSTSLSPQRACSVVFGTTDTVDLAGISFEVDYSAGPGEFVGSGDAVQCALAGGVSATGVFNDDEATQTLIVGIVSGGVISAPTDLVACDYVGALPPIDVDFAITVREAFDNTLAPVVVNVDVRTIACAP